MRLHVDYDRADDSRSPETRLWVAVLLRICRDAMGLECYRHPGEVEAAREWLLSEQNRDRDTVCHLAGADPYRLRAWARAQFPDYRLPPVPAGAEALRLLRQLQRSPPPNLVNWAAEVGVSPSWALDQRRHLMSNTELTALILDRLDHCAVDITALAAELHTSEQRIYFLVYRLARDGVDIVPVKLRCYARSPQYYFDRALRAGTVDVYALADATGYPSRRFRRLVDSRRRAGAPLVCIGRGLFVDASTAGHDSNSAGMARHEGPPLEVTNV